MSLAWGRCNYSYLWLNMVLYYAPSWRRRNFKNFKSFLRLCNLYTVICLTFTLINSIIIIPILWECWFIKFSRTTTYLFHNIRSFYNWCCLNSTPGLFKHLNLKIKYLNARFIWIININLMKTSKWWEQSNTCMCRTIFIYQWHPKHILYFTTISSNTHFKTTNRKHED